jgi:hypothetical protein
VLDEMSDTIGCPIFMAGATMDPHANRYGANMIDFF